MRNAIPTRNKEKKIKFLQMASQNVIVLFRLISTQIYQSVL